MFTWPLKLSPVQAVSPAACSAWPETPAPVEMAAARPWPSWVLAEKPTTRDGVCIRRRWPATTTPFARLVTWSAVSGMLSRSARKVLNVSWVQASKLLVL